MGTSSFFEHPFLLDEESSTYGAVHSVLTPSAGGPHKSWIGSNHVRLLFMHAVTQLKVPWAQFLEMTEEEVASVIDAREEEPEELEGKELASLAGTLGEEEEPKEEPTSSTSTTGEEEEELKEMEKEEEELEEMEMEEEEAVGNTIEVVTQEPTPIVESINTEMKVEEVVKPISTKM